MHNPGMDGMRAGFAIANAGISASFAVECTDTATACARHVHDRLRAADIVKAIEGAHRNRMFTRRECLGQREFVPFFERVADTADWRDQNPIAAIDAVLRAVDAAGCVARDEFHRSSALRRVRFFFARRRNDRRLKALDRRRRVVDYKSFAVARRRERVRGRVRRRVVATIRR